MSNEDIAYLAGIIDGEGSILLRGISKIPSRTIIEYPRPEITISSTDKELLDWVKDMFGGTISSKKIYKDHHKQSFAWRITNKKAVRLMELCLPYMKIKRKKERALVLIDLSRNFTSPNGKYTEEKLLGRKRLQEKFYEV